MKQISLSKIDLDYMRSEFKGATIKRVSPTEVLAKVNRQPFLYVEVDIVDEVRVTIHVVINGEWVKFYENKLTQRKINKYAETNYSAFLFKGYPELFSDLNEKQLNHVLRAERMCWMDVTLDEVICATGSALFSEAPVMEINVGDYPRCFSKRVLKKFKVDTSRADRQCKSV